MQAPRRSQPLRSGPAPPKYGSTPSSPNQTPTGVCSNVSPTPSRPAMPRITSSAGVSPGKRVTPEHPARLVVPRRELLAPALVGPDRRRRLVERVRVDERAAADARAREHEHVAERASAAGCRGSRGAAPRGSRGRASSSSGGPRARTGALPRAPPTAVALLGQPQRGDGAAEAAAYDDDVKIASRHAASISPAEPCSTSAARASYGVGSRLTIASAAAVRERLLGQAGDRPHLERRADDEQQRGIARRARSHARSPPPAGARRTSRHPASARRRSRRSAAAAGARAERRARRGARTSGQLAVAIEPCTSITSREPAPACSRSTFCVITACTIPRASSSRER